MNPTGNTPPLDGGTNLMIWGVMFGVLIAVALVLALPLGTLAGRRPGGTWDRWGRVLAVVGVSLPNFWLGPLLLLAFAVYLAKKGKSLVFSGIPLIFMLFMTGWAMILNLEKFYGKGDWFLFIIGLIVFLLEIWMVIESIIVISRHKQEAPGTAGEASTS